MISKANTQKQTFLTGVIHAERDIRNGVHALLFVMAMRKMDIVLARMDI